MGIDQQDDGCHSHQENTVTHGQAHRQGCKAVRKPGIHSHVGHDSRSVNETCLGCHQQQGTFREDGDKGNPVVEGLDEDKEAIIEYFGEDFISRAPKSADRENDGEAWLIELAEAA